MTTALVKNPGVTAPEIREHHPAKFEPADWFDYPCMGGCGLLLSEPYVTCGSCQVQESLRSAHEQRKRDEEERLVVTERRCGPFVIRTCGYAIYVEVLGSTAPKPYPYGHLLNSWDAERLAEVLQGRATFVRQLKSPYKPRSMFSFTWKAILDEAQGKSVLGRLVREHVSALDAWENEGGPEAPTLYGIGGAP